MSQLDESSDDPATTVGAVLAPDAEEGSAGFHSVLFAGPGPEPGPVAQPQSFADLNLDQLVAAVTEANERYDLAEFFFVALHDPEQVDYRHQVLRDLDRAEVFAAIERFVGAMHEMRDRLRLSTTLHDVRQRQRWFLAAADVYCDAIERLAVDLASVSPASVALRGLRAYVAAYRHGDAFARLATQTKQLIDDLDRIRYTVSLRGLEVTVDHFADEPDLTQEVQDTFARFRETAAKSYRARFYEHAEADTVESRILALVAQLNPEAFQRLAEFCERHADYFDPTVARFDREIHFYLGYLSHIAPLREAGVEFCLPTVSDTTKSVEAEGACDLVLAGRLVDDHAPVVANDFALSGVERILVVSGPNQGGKTTFARMFGQLHHLAALGLPVPARRAAVYLPDRIFCHFEREEDISTLRSKFEEELVRIHEVLAVATDRSLLIMNESFSSTTADDALRIGRRVLEQVIELGMICVFVTFVDELASLGPETVSMMSTVDPDDLTHRTFRVIRKPADGLAYAVALAERHGLGYEQLKRRLAP